MIVPQNIKSSRSRTFTLIILFALLFLFLQNACKKETPICEDASLKPIITVPTPENPALPAKCVTIRWMPQADVLGYLVQVSRSSTLENEGDDTFQEVEIEARAYFDAHFRRNGTHYFRVKTLLEDCESEWSEIGLLESDVFSDKDCEGEEELGVPDLISPSQNDSLEGTEQILLWTEIIVADFYHLQVAKDTSFNESSLVFNNEEIVEPERILQGFIPGKYHWRVRSGKEESTNAVTVWSGWSFIQSFFILE